MKITVPFTHVPVQEKDEPEAIRENRCPPRLTWCGPYALAVINEMSCYEANDRIKRALRVRRKLGRMWFQEVEPEFAVQVSAPL